jgi:hypothetical protein
VIAQREVAVEHDHRSFPVNVMSLHRFVAGVAPIEEPLASLDSLQGTGDVLLDDSMVLKGLFYIHITGRSSLSNLVINDEGRLIAETSPEVVSLCPDGRTVLGHVLRTTKDEALEVLDGHLFAADLKGRWRAAIEGAGTGMDPRPSMEGSFLAYEDPIHGGICVGKLIFEDR